ncbi:zinc ribbon domain-containing protein [Candidatus Zixiibacteriota bacterium]
MYDLKCSNCGHEFEDLVSSHDALSETSCEKCEATGLELKPSLFSSSVAAGVSGATSGGSCAPGPFR